MTKRKVPEPEPLGDIEEELKTDNAENVTLEQVALGATTSVAERVDLRAANLVAEDAFGRVRVTEVGYKALRGE